MLKLFKSISVILFSILVLIGCPPTDPDSPDLPDSWSVSPASGGDPESPQYIAEQGSINYHGDVRTVSLKTLQEQLDAGSTTDDVLQLGGLKKVYGYVLDEENEDILLVGSCDGDLPVIYTEDFVIALRNAYFYYGMDYPGVTIDPDLAAMAILNGLMDDYGEGTITLEELQTQWADECIAAQQPVGVFGMPFDSHFAEVLVDADYDMKYIVNGQDDLGIDGLTSLMDRRVAQAESGDLTNLNIANRFWFSPENVTFLDDDNMILFQECSVYLQTENLDPAGPEDPLAGEFVEDFNDHFDEVAALRPVYKEMENLFRLYAIAQVMYYKNVSSTWISYFLDDFTIPFTDVPDFMSGCSEIRVVEYEDPEGGTGIIVLATCGGVELPIEILPENLQSPADTTAGQLHGTLVGNNKNGNLFTNIYFSPDSHVIGAYVANDPMHPEYINDAIDRINDMLITDNTRIVVLELENFTLEAARGLAQSLHSPHVIFDRIDASQTGIFNKIFNLAVTGVNGTEPQDNGDGTYQITFRFLYEGDVDPLDIFLDSDQRQLLEEIYQNAEFTVAQHNDKYVHRILDNILKDYSIEELNNTYTSIGNSHYDNRGKKKAA